MTKFISDIIELISSLLPLQSSLTLLASTAFGKKMASWFKHEMDWLRQGRKKKNNLHDFSHGRQKNLSNQKVDCKADWKSAPAQKTKSIFWKSLGGFQKIT